MPGDALPVAAQLAGAPAAPVAPGGVQVDPGAAVTLAGPQQGPVAGVGQQLDGVPGHGGEQGPALHAAAQLPYEVAFLVPNGTQARGWPGGQRVDPGQGPLVRFAAVQFRPYEGLHVGPQ